VGVAGDTAAAEVVDDDDLLPAFFCAALGEDVGEEELPVKCVGDTVFLVNGSRPGL
jgi:hypothetical protein